MAWFRRQNQIDEAIDRGDLDQAIEMLQNSSPENNVAQRQRLVKVLIDQIQKSIDDDHLAAAWRQLTIADRHNDVSHNDVSHNDVRQQSSIEQLRHQLIELIVENAESLLHDGKTNHAAQLAGLLAAPEEVDYRATRICRVAECLQAAERFAELGKFESAVEQLTFAAESHPELSGLKERIECKQRRHLQLEKLIGQLQTAAISCHWKEVGQFCDQILAIAPMHEIALGAKRHAGDQWKRRTSAGSKITNVPERPKQNVDDAITVRVSTTAGGRCVISDVSSTKVADQAKPKPPAKLAPTKVASTTSFLIWIDGVGGYLVCTEAVNMIGQAIDGAGVSIPLQADLRQRHARVETITGQHLVHPLGTVKVDGRLMTDAFVLKTGQSLSLGDGVRLGYTQTHPLSKTARLDFVSRHRTLPWSDGVLLACKSIILGPNPNNHVYCPRWKQDVILFQRKDQWYCRCKSKFRLDDQPLAHEFPIQFDSKITGDDFSMTLEPVFEKD